jgi:hypothetical protein
MPSKRAVLQQFKRGELLTAVDRFGLEVGDRRVNEQLVDALAGSRKAHLADILGDMSRDQLKEICRALDLDDTGREKAVLIARLTGTAEPGSTPPKVVAAESKSQRPAAPTAPAVPKAAAPKPARALKPRRTSATKPSSGAWRTPSAAAWTRPNTSTSFSASSFSSTFRTPSRSSTRGSSPSRAPTRRTRMNTARYRSSGFPPRRAGRTSRRRRARRPSANSSTTPWPASSATTRLSKACCPRTMPTRGHTPDAVVDRPFGSGMRFMNGDTLVARITPCLENGKTAFVDFLEGGQVGWGSTEYIVLRPKLPLPSEFAYCLARSVHFRDFAIQSMTGSSGRQRVPAEALEHFLIATSPEPIARAFGRAVTPLFARASRAAEESRILAALRDALLPKLISGALPVPDRLLVPIEAE